MNVNGQTYNNTTKGHDITQKLRRNQNILWEIHFRFIYNERMLIFYVLMHTFNAR